MAEQMPQLEGMRYFAGEMKRLEARIIALEKALATRPRGVSFTEKGQ